MVSTRGTQWQGLVQYVNSVCTSIYIPNISTCLLSLTAGNYEARDYSGRTPLHLAAELGNTLFSLV